MESRRIEGSFNQGWGFASFVVLLVALCFAIAFTVNRRMHHSPNALTVLGSSAGETR